MSTAPRLTLRITNVDALPDGGPLFHVTEGRNFEAGRNRAMAWVLPDPSNYISGEHFRVLWHGGRYWLQDVSTNGTYLVGQTIRLPGPHAIAAQDRFQVGHYLIEAELAQPQPAAFAGTFPPANPADIWALNPASAPPYTPAPAQSPSMPPFAAPPVPAHAGTNPPIIQPMHTHPPQAAPGADLMAAFARGAGLPAAALQGPHAEAVAEEIGRCLRIVTEQMMALLAGRAAAKKVLKSRNRTMIGADGNNPLKMTGDTSTVLLAMFVQRASYMMPPAQAYAEGFDDLKRHQAAIFSAMQSALAKLLEDLSPEAVEGATPGGAFSSRKAQAWEVFTERWDAKTRPHENGMLDVFLAHFAAAYDATTGKTPPRQG